MACSAGRAAGKSTAFLELLLSSQQVQLGSMTTMQYDYVVPFAAYPMSEDHKPNRVDERKRIEQAGGVVVWAGTWRVGGVLAGVPPADQRHPQFENTLMMTYLAIVGSEGAVCKCTTRLQSTYSSRICCYCQFTSTTMQWLPAPASRLVSSRLTCVCFSTGELGQNHGKTDP